MVPEMPMKSGASILWTRNDRSGHEYARVSPDAPAWLIRGVAVFEHDELPCCLNYGIRCDERWLTTEARVWGVAGDEEVSLVIAADAARNWTVNGIACPGVAGAIDVDLNFSPSTNMLPIRRLNLAVGQGAPVRAAWLRFPGFALEPLEQEYTRTGANTYRYESAGGRFMAALDVDASGFPLSYSDLWTAVASMAADR